MDVHSTPTLLPFSSEHTAHATNCPKTLIPICGFDPSTVSANDYAQTLSASLPRSPPSLRLLPAKIMFIFLFCTTPSSGPGIYEPSSRAARFASCSCGACCGGGDGDKCSGSGGDDDGRCDGDGDGGGGVGGDDGGCGDHSRDDGGTYSLSPLSSLTPLSLLFSLLVCSFLAPLLFFFVCFLALDQHRLLIQVPYDLRLILALLVEKSKPPLHDRHSP